MELNEYPRPDNDTGIGVHWVAGYASATSMARIREIWIPEMRALGVKWVKLFTHDGALDLVELLLAEGFMPVVRLYRSSPNPGRLSVKEIVHLDALIRAGVHYFEFNSEPDKESGWKGSRLPANALELVAENTIADMETILERGGMPAVPALSGGSDWDLVGRMVESGRRDLFDGPVWQAIHNYSRNRPLDYPHDIGNQEGSAYTERFYRVVAEEPWGEPAWRGRSLSDVNRLRLGRANPGADIADDHDCWLSFKFHDALNRRHLGRSIPILSTECGYLVGEDLDPRYPATTPDLHMAQTLEACRIMMGASRRFEAAPDYYFCSAFWLLANRELGSSSDWWEGHAWYSDRWSSGVLPIVRALHAEPKVVRRWQTAPSAEARIRVQGSVPHAVEHEIVVVEREGREVARAAIDGMGQYRIDDLAVGPYVLRLQESQISQPVELHADQPYVIVNFEQGTRDVPFENGVVYGNVHGGAGAVVVLMRPSDGEEWVTLAREDGSFRFVDLPAGVYAARVHNQASQVNGIVLDGRNEVEAPLVSEGWGYTIRYLEDEPRAYTGAISCAVEGRKGLAVFAEQGAWRSDPVLTGSAPEHGPYACVLAPLDVGDYRIVVADPNESDTSESEASRLSAGTVDTGSSVERADEPLPLEARVHVDRKRLPLLSFVYNEIAAVADAENSSIRIDVDGAVPGSQVTVALIDSYARRTELSRDDGQPFTFEDLAQGLYAVEIVGHEQTARQTDIAVDGLNHVDIRLRIPAETSDGSPVQPHSRIAGTAPAASGALATLVDEVGNEFSRVVDDDGSFSFSHLPPGVYALRVEGGYLQDGIGLDGVNGVEVIFSELVQTWHAEQSNAGAMPGFSILCVEVDGQVDLPVRIWQEDGASLVRQTGSSEGLSADVAEFRPLEAGRYLVEPEGLDVHAAAELTGLETVWISFRERFEPSEPNQIQPLVESEPAAAIWEAADDGIEPARDMYVFLGDGSVCTDDIAQVLVYMAEHQPRMGRDLGEAIKADRVLLLGDVDAETMTKLEPQIVAIDQLAGG